MKYLKIISYFLCVILLASICNIHVFATADDVLSLSCPSAILVDYASGEVLYEKNPDEKRAIASVTKIMTMLICMEEIYLGNISYDDIVVGSANAKSYGGSTIYLDEGEKMSIRDLLKGIAVASGNDACVAVAEYICGSEAAFVSRMNDTAKKLGMNNTNFMNCNGLDVEGHYSTARDIAIMSKALMKYDDIFQFTTIWMDSLRNGSFTLSNTNKLIKYYDGATGLKTGSTDDALFCISATAKRNNMHLIAVVLGAETSKLRQADASAMLNYGFSNYESKRVVDVVNNTKLIHISKGSKKHINIIPEKDLDLIVDKNSQNDFKVSFDYKSKINAPVKKGDKAGTITIVSSDSTQKHTVNLLFDENVEKRSFKTEFCNNLKKIFG